jgi:hypothetical protein
VEECLESLSDHELRKIYAAHLMAMTLWAPYSPYCYARNNPLGGVDPSGKGAQLLVILAVIVILAILFYLWFRRTTTGALLSAKPVQSNANINARVQAGLCVLGNLQDPEADAAVKKINRLLKDNKLKFARVRGVAAFYSQKEDVVVLNTGRIENASDEEAAVLLYGEFLHVSQVALVGEEFSEKEVQKLFERWLNQHGFENPDYYHYKFTEE